MLQAVLVAVTLGLLFSVGSRAEVELLRPRAVSAGPVQPVSKDGACVPSPV